MTSRDRGAVREIPQRVIWQAVRNPDKLAARRVRVWGGLAAAFSCELRRCSWPGERGGMTRGWRVELHRDARTGERPPGADVLMQFRFPSARLGRDVVNAYADALAGPGSAGWDALTVAGLAGVLRVQS